MLMREIGNTEIKCSAIGLGTWAIGGAMWGGADDNASRSAISASLDEGISLIDSAPGYGLGHAEKLVGEVVKVRRDQVVIATKCGLNWHHGRGEYFFDQYGKRVHRYLGTEGIVHEVEESLKRLGTDYIDIYITHWQDSTTPIDVTMEALLNLKAEGKIRAIGASNLSTDDLTAYIDVGGLDCIQEKYSLIDRQIESSLLPLTETKGISTLSYSPMGMGLLTGKVLPDRVFSGDDIRKDDPRFSIENRKAVQHFSESLDDILNAHNISLSELVIAWTMRQQQIDFVLCGARNQDQAKANARAGRVELSDNEIAIVSERASEHLSGLLSTAVDA